MIRPCVVNPILTFQVAWLVNAVSVSNAIKKQMLDDQLLCLITEMRGW